jgi:hypothetical protein
MYPLPFLLPLNLLPLQGETPTPYRCWQCRCHVLRCKIVSVTKPQCLLCLLKIVYRDHKKYCVYGGGLFCYSSPAFHDLCQPAQRLCRYSLSSMLTSVASRMARILEGIRRVQEVYDITSWGKRERRFSWLCSAIMLC